MDKLLEQALNAQRIKKDGAYYRFVGKNNKLIEVSIMDELINDKLVSEYLSERKELLLIVLEALNESATDNAKLDLELIRERILTLLIINPSKKYAEVEFDYDGYISKGKEVTGEIVEITEMPDNIDNGCHKVIDNKVVLDEAKLQQKILLEED